MSDLSMTENRNAIHSIHARVEAKQHIITQEARSRLLARAYRLAGMDAEADATNEEYDPILPAFMDIVDHLPLDSHVLTNANSLARAWMTEQHADLKTKALARKDAATSAYLIARDTKDWPTANAALAIIGRVDRELPYLFA